MNKTKPLQHLTTAPKAKWAALDRASRRPNIEPSTGNAAKHGKTALDGEGNDSPFATAVAHDIREPRVEVRKLFDIVRDDIWNATKHEQQQFTYGSPPGREDFYFAGK